MPCARFIVRGRVQGVFFRASTREQALRLGIGGVARNLDDGAVEVLACGNGDALDALERWLQHGPPSARVERVTREAMPDRDITDRDNKDRGIKDHDITVHDIKGFSTA